MSDAPLIFSEGIAITTNPDGSFNVEDIASGLPIGRVVSLHTEQAPEGPPFIVTTLEIDTIGMRCELRIEHSTTDTDTP